MEKSDVGQCYEIFKYLNQNLVSPGKILLKEGSSDLRVE